MPVVGMPDGTQVSFPDEMPADQIRSLIAQKFPEETKTINQPSQQQAAPQQPSQGSSPLASAAGALSGLPVASLVGAAGKLYNAIPEDARNKIGAEVSDRFTGRTNEFGPIGLAGKAYRAITDPLPPTVAPGLRREDFTDVPGESQPNTPLVERATQIAATGSPMSAGSMARRGTGASLPQRPQDVSLTSGQLKNAAAAGYKDVRDTGASFSPEIANTLADHVIATLENKGSFSHLADNVHKTVDILRSKEPIGIDKVRSVQEALSTLKIDPDSKVRRAAGMASEEITKFLERTEPEIAETLKTANANYSAGSHMQEIDQLKQIAGVNTGKAGYGGNAVNHMRQALAPTLKSAIKGNLKGYTPEEMTAIQKIVDGDNATNTLRGIGQLSPSKGIFATAGAAATGGVSAVIGAASNKLASVLTAKQIEHLDTLISRRSPAYKEAVSKAADKYFEAAEQFANEPSQKALVGTVVAARALASGLKRDGIDVSSGKLLEYLQSTGPSKGQDDQEGVPREPRE